MMCMLGLGVFVHRLLLDSGVPFSNTVLTLATDTGGREMMASKCISAVVNVQKIAYIKPHQSLLLTLVFTDQWLLQVLVNVSKASVPPILHLLEGEVERKAQQ